MTEDDHYADAIYGKANIMFQVGKSDQALTLIEKAIVIDDINPEYYYLTEGIVLLNRASHSWLDANLNPLTGKSIDKEEVYGWWEFILGDLYEPLMERIGKKLGY